MASLHTLNLTDNDLPDLPASLGYLTVSYLDVRGHFSHRFCTFLDVTVLLFRCRASFSIVLSFLFFRLSKLSLFFIFNY
jgi:Leucine-rich repeat (LRR) protein